MFSTVRFSLLLALCCLQLSCGRSVYEIQTDGSNSTSPDQRARVAVWGNMPSTISAASTWLHKRGVVIIERVQLDQVLNEQRIRLRHTAEDEADLLRIGRLVGATMIVFADGMVRTGQFGNASVTIRAVDVEQALVLWSGRAQYIGPLEYVEYAITGLTCEALATAWGYRKPGTHSISSSSHCGTP